MKSRDGKGQESPTGGSSLSFDKHERCIQGCGQMLCNPYLFTIPKIIFNLYLDFSALILTD